MPALVWKGKGAETPRLTFPVVTDEVHGNVESDDAEPNRLILGDASAVLPTMLERYAGRAALVYIDPPFETGGQFDFLASIPGAGDETARVALPAYRDARGLDAWVAWFFDTAVILRDWMAEGASLYVHLDPHAVHYAKVVLDEVFGPKAFQREIIWRIGWVSGFKSRARGWIRNHDTLLFYAKGERPSTFHKTYLPYPAGYRRRDGKLPRGLGHPVDDVWNAGGADRMDSIQIMSFSGEKVGYPTQKNEALLARIVSASSNPGDLVVDCFVGSGTSAVVAEKLGRRWVASDASPLAIHASRKRLMSLSEPKPFLIEHIGSDSNTVERRGARELAACGHVSGHNATIELSSFRMVWPSGADAQVAHWSQWLEGWCVDWDHRDGALRVGSRQWRGRGASNLPLAAAHSYSRPGRYVALVRAFDVLGGTTTVGVNLEVGPR